MRRGEILNLKWEDVHIDEKFIFVKHTKTYNSRKIPINDVVLGLLKGMQINRGLNEYVFFNQKTNKPFVEVSSAWNTLLKRAHITNLTFDNSTTYAWT
jgi:integrase